MRPVRSLLVGGRMWDEAEELSRLPEHGCRTARARPHGEEHGSWPLPSADAELLDQTDMHSVRLGSSSDR
jgi:hypothetical protein